MFLHSPLPSGRDQRIGAIVEAVATEETLGTVTSVDGLKTPVEI